MATRTKTKAQEPVVKPLTQSAFEAELQMRLRNAGFEVNKRDVQEILDTVGDILKDSLKKQIAAADRAHQVAKKSRGDVRVPNPGVTLRGLGKFTVRYYPARQGRNPQTGESIKIPASKKLRATVVKKMRDDLKVK